MALQSFDVVPRMAKENWLRLKNMALAMIVGLFLFSSCGKKAAEEVLQKPTEGDFEVIVTTTGELQAKNSVDISGPTGARS